MVIYINEDNLFTWDKAKNARTGTYINAGTGTWSLKDDAGVEIATGSLAYVAASNGKWQATIDKLDAADLAEDQYYYVEMTLTDGAGADAFRKILATAKYHAETP